MSGARGLVPPSRWAELDPQRWPQDVNRVPGTPGMPMPPVSAANAERSRRESFTMSGTWTVVPGLPALSVFPLYLPTDPDGDFWCDQIAVVGWFSAHTEMVRPAPALVTIADARTGRSLTWPPAGVPINFFTTLLLFSDDPGFDPAASPYPDGFRSTTTLPEPFCFTRAGGIQLTMTILASSLAPETGTTDIAFSGWKEYERASS